MNRSYNGNTDPEHWNNVCTLARTGRRQSPVDLRDAEPGGVGDFSEDYRPVRIKLRDTARNYRFDCGKGCRVRIAGSEFHLDPSKFLPPNRARFVYPGSITTPPCTEGVTWVVFKTPLHASVAQIKKFQSHRPHTCRPLQPLNGREIRFGR